MASHCFWESLKGGSLPKEAPHRGVTCLPPGWDCIDSEPSLPLCGLRLRSTVLLMLRYGSSTCMNAQPVKLRATSSLCGVMLSLPEYMRKHWQAEKEIVCRACGASAPSDMHPMLHCPATQPVRDEWIDFVSSSVPSSASGTLQLWAEAIGTLQCPLQGGSVGLRQD